MYLARLYDKDCLNVHLSILCWILHLRNLSCFCLCFFLFLGRLTFRLLALSRALSSVLALPRLWLGVAFLLAWLLSFAGAFDVLDFAPAPAGDLTFFATSLVQPDLQTRVRCSLGKGCAARVSAVGSTESNNPPDNPGISSVDILDLYTDSHARHSFMNDS